MIVALHSHALIFLQMEHWYRKWGCRGAKIVWELVAVYSIIPGVSVRTISFSLGILLIPASSSTKTCGSWLPAHRNINFPFLPFISLPPHSIHMCTASAWCLSAILSVPPCHSYQMALQALGSTYLKRHDAHVFSSQFPGNSPRSKRLWKMRACDSSLKLKTS